VDAKFSSGEHLMPESHSRTGVETDRLTASPTLFVKCRWAQQAGRRRAAPSHPLNVLDLAAHSDPLETRFAGLGVDEAAELLGISPPERRSRMGVRQGVVVSSLGRLAGLIEASHQSVKHKSASHLTARRHPPQIAP
jgi:hypothetical protein